jgi:hypothetical protein
VTCTWNQAHWGILNMIDVAVVLAGLLILGLALVLHIMLLLDSYEYLTPSSGYHGGAVVPFRTQTPVVAARRRKKSRRGMLKASTQQQFTSNALSMENKSVLELPCKRLVQLWSTGQVCRSYCCGYTGIVQ